MGSGAKDDGKTRQSSAGKFFGRRLHKERDRGGNHDSHLGADTQSPPASVAGSQSSRHSHRASVASIDRPVSMGPDQGLSMHAGVLTSLPYENNTPDARTPTNAEFSRDDPRTVRRAEPLPHHLNKGGGDFHQVSGRAMRRRDISDFNFSSSTLPSIPHQCRRRDTAAAQCHRDRRRMPPARLLLPVSRGIEGCSRNNGDRIVAVMVIIPRTLAPTPLLTPAHPPTKPAYTPMTPNPAGPMSTTRTTMARNQHSHLSVSIPDRSCRPPSPHRAIRIATSSHRTTPPRSRRPHPSPPVHSISSDHLITSSSRNS